MCARSMLPLTMLGLLWGWLYILSGNLLVPILVHAM
jgi:membrane protease YdiL (CAAX protease family)